MEVVIGLFCAIALIFLLFPDAGKPKHVRNALRDVPLAEICWKTREHHWTEWKGQDQLESDIVFSGIPRLDFLRGSPEGFRYRYCGYCKDIDYTYSKEGE